MSTLIVQLPPQPRLVAQHAPAPGPGRAPAEFDFVYLDDSRKLTRQGRCAVEQLPSAQKVVAVLAPDDVGWHRLPIPKSPASRLRQALSGLLEEALLEDDGDLHLALAPRASAGERAWVAAVSKPWLAGQLHQLEALGLTIDRVVPGWPPEGPLAGHVFSGERGLRLAWRDEHGPLCLPLDSPSARSLVAEHPDRATVAWSACPEGTADAAVLAGAPVAAQGEADWLQAAAASDWNLRQFDLAAQRRGQRALREALTEFWNDPTWRPLRWGLGLLLALQLLGVNLWAWQQNRALAERKSAMVALLQSTFPQVRAVFDAPIQMQKEIDLLRAAAGKPGETDLETLLYAAQAAWPAGLDPADELRYETGKLTLVGTGWTATEIEALRSRLRPIGLDAEAAGGGVQIARSRGPLVAAVSPQPANPAATKPAAAPPRPTDQAVAPTMPAIAPAPVLGAAPNVAPNVTTNSAPKAAPNVVPNNAPPPPPNLMPKPNQPLPPNLQRLQGLPPGGLAGMRPGQPTGQPSEAQR